MKIQTGSLLAIATVFAPAALLGQPLAFGPEFPVNTYTTGAQQQSAIAGTGDGSFVVVWSSADQDGSNSGIFGQRFDGTGAKIGEEFQVNTYTTGNQGQPSVAADGDGNFTVVWSRDFNGIFGQRFDASGVKAGPEFEVTYSPSTYFFQFAPAVAADAPGNFVVVWESLNNGTGYVQPGYQFISGQRFDSSGAKAGPAFPVSPDAGVYGAPNASAPSIAADGAGHFVVVWENTSGDVQGQRLDSSGVKSGLVFQVNIHTAYVNQKAPSVAAGSAGDFVVVWQSVRRDGTRIFGQRFNSSGTKTGFEFQVDTDRTRSPLAPKVAADRAGNWLAVWESTVLGGSSFDIFGQQFDRFGNRAGSEFRINTPTRSFRGDPAVVGDGPGFVVIWSGDTLDRTSSGVLGRREQSVRPKAMAVDAHSGATSNSDANGVLEPGEQVLLEPTWGNLGVSASNLAGSLSSFMGPAGGVYALQDSSADYGTIVPGAVANCNDGSSDACYAVSVAGTRPAPDWDAIVEEGFSAGGGRSWALHVGDSFTDVPRRHLFYRKVETMLHHGITAGCSTNQFCPDEPVRRDQMAVFLGRAIAGGGDRIPRSGMVGNNPYNCTGGSTSLFSDVDPADPTCKAIHFIRAENVAAGCGGGAFCVARNVTRAEMALFVARAIAGPEGDAAVPQTYGPDPLTGQSYSCNPAGPNLHFADVAVSDDSCRHTHFLWAKGLIGGCSESQYCPAQPVTRAQMAKFLANAFHLELYGP